MKKKAKSLESMLKRAEKLFKKGSYALAKDEFERVNEFFRDDDIAEKIKICEKEFVQLKAKDLIKRGRKSVRKGSLQEAIRCFEEAYQISGEDWLSERISELKAELSGRESFKAAKDAEASGDYEKAAVLYEEAFATQESEDILLKRASSLIKAEKYEDAISIFRNLSMPDDRARYDYGFALVKTHQYYECLKIWNTVQSKDDEFLEQKSLAQSLLASDLYDRFFQAKAGYSDPGVQDDPFAAIYEEGTYLIQNLKPKFENRNSQNSVSSIKHQASSIKFQASSFKGLIEYSKYAWTDQLWKKGQYETIMELLLPYPSEMDADMLALYAKTFFKLAEISEKYMPEFTMFWLTALYNHEIFMKLSPVPDERETIRQSLIQKAEDLIKRWCAKAGRNSLKTAISCWNAEKQALKDLNAIAGDISASETNLACAPKFAQKFGMSEHIICLIRDNRDFFSDTEHYLETGGYYSSAGQSLFHLHKEEYEDALANLPGSGAPRKEQKDAEFIAYCIERVHFAYGLYCLKKGDGRSARYFENAAVLFEKSPKYEKDFIEKTFECRDTDELGRYENALNEIYSKRPTKEITEALSLTMVRRAVRLYNARQLNIKAAEAVVVKAMSLNPDNELARTTLERMQVDIEMEELFKAISKHKMNKACQIAAKSQIQEVRDEFFDFMEYNLEHVEEMDMDDHEKVILLNDFFKWCARVDEKHPILYDIDEMIKDLEIR